MLKKLYILLAVILVVAAHSPAEGGSDCKGTCASCHNLSIKEAETLLKKTGGTVTSIKHAPIKGMFELLMEKDGRQGVIFVDYAKSHFMQGFIVNFDSLKKVSAHDTDLPQPKQATNIGQNTIPAESAIVMGNPLGTRKVFVFSDPDCPYSGQQHTELKKLAKRIPELVIYVMLYPLPMHHGSYDKSRALLTFRNRFTLDGAFNGEPPPVAGTEDNRSELNEIINLARRSGITATPSIVLPDGRVLSGFTSSEVLIRMLDEIN